MTRRYVIIFALLALVAGAVQGCSVAQGSGAYAGAHDLAMAGSELEQLTPEQCVQQGDAHAARGAVDLARVYYNRALQLEPDNLDVRVRLARVMAAKGQSEEALAECQRVLESDPANAAAHACAAEIFLHAGMAAQARSHFEASLATDPGRWQTHNALGVLYNQAGEHERAVAAFATALGLSPENPDVLNNMGLALAMTGQHDLAVDALTRAARQGSGSPRAINNLGLALVRQGEIQRAFEVFSLVGTAAQANNNLGYALLVSGDPDTAIIYLERAVELSPTYYDRAFENLRHARLAASFDAQRPLARPAAAPAPAMPTLPEPEPVSAPVPVPSSAREAELPAEPVQQAAVEPHASVAPVRADQPQGFGLHVSSWRDVEWANRHAAQLAEQGYETHVVAVDLPEKGRWYRVLVGQYASFADARAEAPGLTQALEIDQAAVVRITPLEPGVGAGERL